MKKPALARRGQAPLRLENSDSYRAFQYTTTGFGQSPFVSSGYEYTKDEHLDYFGKVATDRHLYFNTRSRFNGLICGSRAQEVNTLTNKLIHSHLLSGYSCLLFHTSNHSPIETPFPLLSFNSKRTQTYISPRSAVKNFQLYTPHHPQRLSFFEQDITLRHVLAMYTPPKSHENCGKILDSIQHLISQLNESFNLQRFMELINREKWDEAGAIFIALRHTLLTNLVSGETKLSDQDAQPEGVTIVDLSDPILSSTGIDVVLMDMALRKFILSRPATPKVIVFSSAHEYLQSNTLLARSIASFASLEEIYQPSILITTTNLPLISSDMINNLDYILCGNIKSPEWKRLITERYGLDLDLRNWNRNRSGLITIVSPQSSRIAGKIDEAKENKHEDVYWNGNEVHVDINDITLSISSLPSLNFTSNTQTGAANVLQTRQTRTTAEKEHVSGQVANKQDFSPGQVPTEDTFPGQVICRPSTRDATSTPEASLSSNLDGNTSNAPKIIQDGITEEHRRLVAAILELTGGCALVPVKSPAVRQIMNASVITGKKKFRQIVLSAVDASLVKLSDLKDSCQMITLLELPSPTLNSQHTPSFDNEAITPADDIDNSNTASVSTSSLSPEGDSPGINSISQTSLPSNSQDVIPEVPGSIVKEKFPNVRWDLPPVYFRKQHTSALPYPQRFQSLVGNMLGLTQGLSNTPILSSQIQKCMGTKKKFKAFGFGSFHKMINQAWKENIIRFGSIGGKQAIILINIPATLTTPDDKRAMMEIAKSSLFHPIAATVSSLAGGCQGDEISVSAVRSNLKANFGRDKYGFMDPTLYIQLATENGVLKTGSKRKVSLARDWNTRSSSNPLCL